MRDHLFTSATAAQSPRVSRGTGCLVRLVSWLVVRAHRDVACAQGICVVLHASAGGHIVLKYAHVSNSSLQMCSAKTGQPEMDACLQCVRVGVEHRTRSIFDAAQLFGVGVSLMLFYAHASHHYYYNHGIHTSNMRDSVALD